MLAPRSKTLVGTVYVELLCGDLSMICVINAIFFVCLFFCLHHKGLLVFTETSFDVSSSGTGGAEGRKEKRCKQRRDAIVSFE